MIFPIIGILLLMIFAVILFVIISMSFPIIGMLVLMIGPVILFVILSTIDYIVILTKGKKMKKRYAEYKDEYSKIKRLFLIPLKNDDYCKRFYRMNIILTLTMIFAVISFMFYIVNENSELCARAFQFFVLIHFAMCLVSVGYAYSHISY